MPSYSAPVKNTCPDIDSLISDLDSIYDNLIKLSNQEEIDLQELKQLASSLYEQYSGNNSTLEKLRTANSDLRQWGTDWRDEAEEFEEKIKELENKLEEAEETIVDLRAKEE